MDAQERELLEKYAPKSEALQHLWDEHKLLKKQLVKLESKAFLTPVEEQKARELKKQKLEAKTRLVDLLDEIRANDKNLNS